MDDTNAVTGAAPLVRTDFSDDVGWRRLVDLVSGEYGDFQAQLDPIDDRRFAGLTATAASAEGVFPGHSFVLLADRVSLTDPEATVVVVEVGSGRSFRVVPAQVWSVENNLSLANLDFGDFTGNCDADGVFRGFP
jgi:hypothetical protein